MATYRVPALNTAAPPFHDNTFSTTQPSYVQQESSTTAAPVDAVADSRRNSLSTVAAPSAVAAPVAGPEVVTKPALDPVHHDPAPGTPLNRTKTVYTKDTTYTRHSWSRGKKICCGLLISFVLILVVVAVLIYFLVRTPTVDYVGVDVICANNDYLKCAQDTVQINVHLLVTNPNIIGATINADLGLFKEDGTFLGPGTIQDTDVARRGTTNLDALFTVTSGRAYDILIALYVPPNRDVTVRVDGTIYFHVGSLRPSYQFQRDFVIPKQDLGSSAASLLNSAGVPTSAGDIINSVGNLIPTPSLPSSIPTSVPSSVGSAAGAVVNALPANTTSNALDTAKGLIPGSIASAIPGLHAANPPAATPTAFHPTSITSSIYTYFGRLPSFTHRRSFFRKPAMINPKKFAAILMQIGPPGSERRKQFEASQGQASNLEAEKDRIRRSQSTLSQEERHRIA